MTGESIVARELRGLSLALVNTPGAWFRTLVELVRYGWHEQSVARPEQTPWAFVVISSILMLWTYRSLDAGSLLIGTAAVTPIATLPLLAGPAIAAKLAARCGVGSVEDWLYLYGVQFTIATVTACIMVLGGRVGTRSLWSLCALLACLGIVSLVGLPMLMASRFQSSRSRIKKFLLSLVVVALPAAAFVAAHWSPDVRLHVECQDDLRPLSASSSGDAPTNYELLLNTSYAGRAPRRFFAQDFSLEMLDGSAESPRLEGLGVAELSPNGSLAPSFIAIPGESQPLRMTFSANARLDPEQANSGFTLWRLTVSVADDAETYLLKLRIAKAKH